VLYLSPASEPLRAIPVKKVYNKNSVPRAHKARGVIKEDGIRLPIKEPRRRFISLVFRRVSKDRIERKIRAPRKTLANGHWLKSSRKRIDESNRIREKA
jgi:hypothetical protein